MIRGLPRHGKTAVMCRYAIQTDGIVAVPTHKRANELKKQFPGLKTQVLKPSKELIGTHKYPRSLIIDEEQQEMTIERGRKLMEYLMKRLKEPETPT